MGGGRRTRPEGVQCRTRVKWWCYLVQKGGSRTPSHHGGDPSDDKESHQEPATSIVSRFPAGAPQAGSSGPGEAQLPSRRRGCQTGRTRAVLTMSRGADASDGAESKAFSPPPRSGRGRRLPFAQICTRRSCIYALQDGGGASRFFSRPTLAGWGRGHFQVVSNTCLRSADSDRAGRPEVHLYMKLILMASLVIQ